jgi:hypothetical protein
LCKCTRALNKLNRRRNCHASMRGARFAKTIPSCS